MNDGAPNVTFVGGYCVKHTVTKIYEARRRLFEVLVTHLHSVIEIRPQGEGEGIQAYILVPITRLKPRALDLTWTKTKPTTPLGVGYSSDP